MQTELMIHYFGIYTLIEPAIVEEDTAHHLDRFDDEIILMHDLL